MNKHAIYCSDIEDEQMLKDWLKKEFSDTYYQRDYLFHNKLYFHFPALDNDLKDNFVIGYHTDENIRKDYTKINIKDFLKEYYKVNKTKLLGLPIIKGEQHHLEAFAEDCKKIGYKFEIGQTPLSVISHNSIGLSSVLSDQKSFITLFLGSLHYQRGNIKEFQLPTQWQEALDFMKENMDRWNKIQEENKEPEFKVGDIVVCLDTQKTRNGNKDQIYKIIDLSSEKDWVYIDVASTIHISRLRFATPEEIEAYNNKPKIFKMTSGSGDFELEVSKKGVYYRPEDKWLNLTSINDMLISNNLNHGSIFHADNSGKYIWKTNHVDVGCKKLTLVSQWQEVYDYYKSLQK